AAPPEPWPRSLWRRRARRSAARRAEWASWLALPLRKLFYRQPEFTFWNTDRPGIVNERAENIGHAKGLGVARETPAVASRARRPAEPRGALQHVLAAVRQDPQVTVDALERDDAPVLVGAREHRERPQRLGELDPGRAPALGAGEAVAGQQGGDRRAGEHHSPGQVQPDEEDRHGGERAIELGDRAYAGGIGQHVLEDEELQRLNGVIEHRESSGGRERRSEQRDQREQRGVSQAARGLQAALLVEAARDGMEEIDRG